MMKSRLSHWLVFLLSVLFFLDCSPKSRQNEKNKIYYPTSKGELKEYDYYRITRRDLRTFKKEGIPDSVISKLRNVIKVKDGDAITDQSVFFADIVEKLGFNDAQTYKNTVLYHSKRYLFIGAEAVTRVEPEYPEEIRNEGIEGLVVVKVKIDTMGNVIASDIVKSVPGLDEFALKAVDQFKFTQGVVDDPVIMFMTIPFTFRLE